MKPQVICVPGSVAPAAQRYRPLIEAVADAADAYAHALLSHWLAAETSGAQLPL